jgi:AcrR family transcriptional regulator
MNMFIIEPVQEEPMPRGRPTPSAPPGPAPSAPEGLRERNKREKRERIRRAARELFERKGFEAATAREIAARAGVGLGTLFLYARDKRDLLFRVFEDASQRLFEEGRDAGRRAGDLVEGLMALFGRFHAFYARHPELSGALLREFFFRPYEPERIGALSRSYLDHVAELVARARDRGELRRDVTVEAAAHGLFAHYAYWTQAWLGSRAISRAEADRRLRAALALQIEGLRPAVPARGEAARSRSTPRPPRRRG